MTHIHGISAAGGYLPKKRLKRLDIYSAHSWALPGLRGKSKGERTVASWDEDTITMAVEAARIATTNVDISDLSTLTLASTSHPFKDRSSATVAAAALGLSSQLFTTDTGTNRRAATTALLRELTTPYSDKSAILAAEKRMGKPGSWAEISWGDGAAALIIDDEDPAANLIGWSSVSEDCLDFYTADGFTPYPGEERWVKDEIVKTVIQPTIEIAINNAGIDAADIQWAILPDVVPGTEKKLARSLQLTNAELLTQEIILNAGDLGAAHPIFGLALALEKATAGDRILVCGFGNGCDAMIFTVNHSLPPSKLPIAEQFVSDVAVPYLEFASSRGAIDIDFGPRSERVEKTALTVHERGRRDITGFIGGKTNDDTAVQFPKSAVALSGEFMTPGDYSDVRLADLSGKVASYTTDHLIFTPEPPFCFGLVQFDNGARVLMEYIDIPSQGLSIGDAVRMQFRIKSTDRERGYRHYFWKAAPCDNKQEEK